MFGALEAMLFELDATAVASAAMLSVLAFIVARDLWSMLRGMLLAPRQKPAAPPAPKEAAASPLPAQEPEKPAQAAAPTPAPAAQAQEEKPSGAAEDPLDSLLDSALETMDAEETVIDDAWDKVHARMQVSTHVNGLHDIIQQGAKVFQESAARQKALQKEESSDRNAEQKVQHFRRQGARFLAKGKFEEATVQFSSALRLLREGHADKPAVLCERSEANAGRRDGAAALKDAAKCLELKPGHPEGLCRKARALEVLRKWGEAKSVFQELAKTCPERAGEAEEGVARCDDALLDLLDD